MTGGHPFYYGEKIFRITQCSMFLIDELTFSKLAYCIRSRKYFFQEQEATPLSYIAQDYKAKTDDLNQAYRAKTGAEIRFLQINKTPLSFSFFRKLT